MPPRNFRLQRASLPWCSVFAPFPRVFSKRGRLKKKTFSWRFKTVFNQPCDEQRRRRAACVCVGACWFVRLVARAFFACDAKETTKKKRAPRFISTVHEVKRLVALSCLGIYLLTTCPEAAPSVTRHVALQKDGNTPLRKSACCRLAPRASCCLLRLASSYVATFSATCRPAACRLPQFECDDGPPKPRGKLLEG